MITIIVHQFDAAALPAGGEKAAERPSERQGEQPTCTEEILARMRADFASASPNLHGHIGQIRAISPSDNPQYITAARVNELITSFNSYARATKTVVADLIRQGRHAERMLGDLLDEIDARQRRLFPAGPSSNGTKINANGNAKDNAAA